MSASIFICVTPFCLSIIVINNKYLRTCKTHDNYSLRPANILMSERTNPKSEMTHPMFRRKSLIWYTLHFAVFDTGFIWEPTTCVRADRWHVSQHDDWHGESVCYHQVDSITASHYSFVSFFLFVCEVAHAAFIYQCWGLPHGLAQCTALGARQV